MGGLEFSAPNTSLWREEDGQDVGSIPSNSKCRVGAGSTLSCVWLAPFKIFLNASTQAGRIDRAAVPLRPFTSLSDQ